jgi:hypothetical protein
MFGLHEATQTLEVMKEGMSKSIEVLADMGGKVQEAAVRAGYGPTIRADAVRSRAISSSSISISSVRGSRREPARLRVRVRLRQRLRLQVRERERVGRGGAARAQHGDRVLRLEERKQRRALALGRAVRLGLEPVGEVAEEGGAARVGPEEGVLGDGGGGGPLRRGAGAAQHAGEERVRVLKTSTWV